MQALAELRDVVVAVVGDEQAIRPVLCDGFEASRCVGGVDDPPVGEGVHEKQLVVGVALVDTDADVVPADELPLVRGAYHGIHLRGHDRCRHHDPE